ncbi:aminoglycoside phosphotransferase family protein [Cytobacillus dafuensis]|nr:aminoglycoside phosphotransferase family protein [Cytobacillus dafuensis]
MMQLPSEFVKTLKNVHKEKAEKWLEDFDRLIDECEQRWQMNILSPYELSYHFVAPALRRDGSEVVIKLAIPSIEFYSEVEALRVFNGNGMVKIMDVDYEKGILIFERLVPGITLATLTNDEEATYIAAQIMKKLWKPVQSSDLFQTTFDRETELKRIYYEYPEGVGPVTKETLREATEIFTEMNHTLGTPFMLHGDLHQYNILLNGESWLAIDPKGLIGDREYDVIQFLLNKLPKENIEEILEKRINILEKELHLNKHRVLSWGFSHAVLATCWSFEESGNYNEEFFNSINVFKCLLGKENNN